MEPHLTNIFFIKGHNILYNVLFATKDMAWVEKIQQDLFPMLLNFKKAYDRINWTFF